MDYAKINEAAMGYKDDMTKFLRDLVRIPGESCGEKGHIMRIKEEMEKGGFDKVQIDPMGNILGYMGTGKTLIGFDAHIDTVGIGNIKNWEFDPYEGFESDEEIGGRGTSDQMGGIVSAVYGAKIMKDLGLLNDKYQVLVTVSPAMHKYIWKPATWVLVHKFKALFTKHPYSMYELKICRDYRDGKVTKEDLDKCSTCDMNCVINNGLSEASKEQLKHKTGEEIVDADIAQQMEK